MNNKTFKKVIDSAKETRIELLESNSKVKQLLLLYAGLFEEIFDKDETLMHEDNFSDYKEVISELRKLGEHGIGRGYLERIEDIENELPFN